MFVICESGVRNEQNKNAMHGHVPMSTTRPGPTKISATAKFRTQLGSPSTRQGRDPELNNVGRLPITQ